MHVTPVLKTAEGSTEPNPSADEPAEPEYPLGPDSPWPARQGGWIRWICARSLTLSLTGLFLFALHLLRGAGAYSEEIGRHISAWDYLWSSRFWFESMQNWQSEFLSVATLSVLSIRLRQENSPEFKPVNKPHRLTGA